MIRNIVLSLFLLVPCMSLAGINEDLNHYFNNLGYSSNITVPSAWQGQQAGHYSGGSLFVRNAVRDVQLARIDLPGYRSGCSGIDVYTGGLSYISSEQIVPLMQNIMNNTGSYAFTLAMETASPALANVMKYWNDFASRVNQANINSCEMAENLAGGMWPRMRGAQQRICQDIGSSTGLFSDWAQAKQKCGTGNEFSSTMQRARKDPRYRNLVFDSGNITWKAIRQNRLFGNDNELSEFFMSLSGTVIVRRDGSGDDAPVKFSPLPSLMDSEGNNLVRALLEGGTVRIYRCDTLDEEGCLNPSGNGKITIQADHALGSRIRRILDGMVEKIIADQPLTQEEIGLLQSTSLPVYKMLNVQTAFAGDRRLLDVSGYAEAIATDILFQYLEQSLQVTRASISAAQYPESLLAELRPGIDSELEQLRNMQKNAWSRLAISIQMIQQTQTIERMLAGDLSTRLASSLSWARGLP